MMGRRERFTYQIPKTLVGERLQIGAIEFDRYRSPHGVAFVRHGWTASHRAVVHRED